MSDQTQPQPTDGSESTDSNPPVNFEKKLPYTDQIGFPSLKAVCDDPSLARLLGEPLTLSHLMGDPYPSPYDLKSLASTRRNYRYDLSSNCGKLFALTNGVTIAELQRTKPQALAAIRRAIDNIGEGGKLLVEMLDNAAAFGDYTSLVPKLITLMTDGMPEDSEPTWDDAALSTAGQQLVKNYLGDENPTEPDPARPDLTLLARLRDGLKKLPDDPSGTDNPTDESGTGSKQQSRVYGDSEGSIADTW